MSFPLLNNYDPVFHIGFIFSSKGQAPFHCTAFIPVLIRMVFEIKSVIFHKTSSIYMLLLLVRKFVSRSRLVLMWMHLVGNIRLNPVHLYGLQLLMQLPIFIEIFFFCLHQQNMVRLRPSSDKLAIEPVTSQKLDSRDSWRTAKTVLNKYKFAIPPLMTSVAYCIW